MIPLSSVEETTAEEGSAGEPESDELRRGLLAGFENALGEALVGSHIGAGDLWVRVSAEAWVDAGRFARDQLHCRYFCFLSAIDWLPSPFGRYEDAEVAAALEGRLAEPGAIATGVAGGDSRFQVLARVYSTGRHYGVTLKADVPDDTMTVPSWVPLYAGADWHERETWEMYGISFSGHPNLRHIYLPGDFEGHPLRKDYPLLARVVKPWPGIVDVEPMPEEEEPTETATAEPEAKSAEEMAPEDPPAEAPITETSDVKPAVEAPVDTHGEVASHEQLAEGEKAVEDAGGGGVDTSGIPTGEADSGRPGQGGTGQGTDTAATGPPEETAEAADEAREDPS